MKRSANAYSAAWLIAGCVLLSAASANGTVLWSDVGTTLAHDTGEGKDILGGIIHRDDSSAGVLYFKFHLDPLSDFHTEQYLAGFQLFEGSAERLGVGNAWDAYSYSAFNTAHAENLNRIPREFDLRSAQGSSRAPDGHVWEEYPVRDIERTIVFKVEYIPGSNDVITVWLNPDLGPGATESGQKLNLTTHFTANAAFDEIHLRHMGGGDGWIFSDMAIATTFNDFVAPSPEQSASISEREKGGPPFEFQTWHREQGLLHESVYALAQSRQGYLWIGTEDGVARFDGVHFVSFGLQEGLPSGVMQSLLEDHNGTLWIGTSGNGLLSMRDGKVTKLTKQDGLPSDVVTSLVEDGQGRLWVGTDAGLAVCQNGRVSSVPDEFKDKFITALFEDRQGVLWMGVKGIGIYQRSGEQFTLLESQPVQGLLKDSHCWLVDHEGRLWVGAGDDGILCRDGKEWIRHRISRHFAHPYVKTLAEGADGSIWAGSMGEGLINFRASHSQIVDASSGLSDNFIESLLCDAQGNLWVGTQYGLNKLKRGQLFALTVKEGLGYGAVDGMAEVSPGAIIIGKAEDGLRRWNGTNVNFIPYNFPQGNPQIRAMLVAHDGSFWSAGAQGLWHFNDAGTLASKSVNLRMVRPTPVFPTINAAYNLIAFSEDGVPFSSSASVDPQGHLYSANQLGSSVDWDDSTFKLGPIGGPNAVSGAPFSLPAGRYSTLKLLATGVNGKQESNVFAVNYTDGTASNYTQSLSDWKTPQYYEGESIAVTMPYRNVSDGTRQNHDYHLYGYSFVLNSNKTISSFSPPSDGNVVILAVALSPEVQPQPAPAVPELADRPSIQLPQFVINALCEDSKNIIWAGTQAGELWRCRDGEWTMQTNFTASITSLLRDSEGVLWIGTDGAGLIRFKNQTCTYYGKENGLLSESIRALHFDENGTLWIGTVGGGLSRLRDEKIATFTTREGLPDNTISQILEDDTGRLWLGTDHGIVAVMQDDLEQCAAGNAVSVYPQLYGQGDGMPSEECTGGFFPAGLKTSSGLLCFSTQRGLVIIDPHPQNSATLAPAVILEQLVVDGAVQYSAPESGDTLPDSTSKHNTARDSKNPLLLAPGNHRIEIHYTGLNFEEPGRVHFRYQLEGLDHEWIKAGVQRVASYNYVPPGKYKFRIQAGVEDGTWKESDNPLAFIVPRPFWKSWWFVSASIFMLLIGVAILIRKIEKRRHRQRLEQLEREQAMERERTRIARDLHDEIGGKLCRISYLSKDAVRENGLPGKLQSQITAISETSRKVLQALDEIVWTVDPQNDTLSNFADYIEQVGPEYFETTGIECEVDIPKTLPPRPVSSQVRHQLFSIVQEAWANTLKHSKAARATVKMTFSAETFEIVVSDNGIGFDLSGVDGLPNNNGTGNGLRNMRQRMKEVGGQCVIKAEPGRGTSIRFTILLTRDYPNSEK
jgi:ligand-binding sensor domain-containing protein/signal transduction histidine kinase